MSQQGTWHPVSDVLSHSAVIWDDGLMHGLDCQEELVQQEVLFDECLNVNRTAAVDLLTLLTHGNETFLKEVDMDAANDLFCSVQHEVVWDEELQHMCDDQHGLLKELAQGGERMMQCKHALFKEPIMSNSHVQGLFDEFSSQVVWDDEIPQGVESQDSLLEQLVQAECLIGRGNKLITEPISCKALVETKDVSGELFGERPAWDEDPQHDTEPLDDNLQQFLWGDAILDAAHVVEPLTKEFQVLSSVGCSYLILEKTMDVVAEEETHTEESTEQGIENTIVHSSLLQQFAWGREAFASEIGQPVLLCAELLNNVCSSTVNNHSDLQLSNQGYRVFLIDAYLMDFKHKQAYISISQLDPGVLVLQDDSIAVECPMLDDIWRRAFSPWQSWKLCDHLVFVIMFPWRHSGFSPWSSVHTVLRKSSVELKINGKLADVDSPSLILYLGMDVVHEGFDEMHLVDNLETMAEHVEFMDQVTYVGDEQEVFARIHIGRSTTTPSDEVGLLLQLASGDELLHMQQPDGFDEKTKHTVNPNASVVLTSVSTSCLLNQCMNGADQVFVDFPGNVVVWEVELFHGLDSHDGFLQQLALAGECWDDEKMICIPPSLGATGCQVSECQFSATVVLEIRQETIDACKVLAGMPCQGSTDQAIFDAYHIAGLASQQTENMPSLFGGHSWFLEHAVVHVDHLQGQPGEMWEISADCQMVRVIMKWWHEHVSPWKSNLVWYCYEQMSPWNINIFNPGAGRQQHFRIANLALVPLLETKRYKEFQDKVEPSGAQILLYQFVGAKSEVMEKLRLTFPWDPSGHSSSCLYTITKASA